MKHRTLEQIALDQIERLEERVVKLEGEYARFATGDCPAEPRALRMELDSVLARTVLNRIDLPKISRRFMQLLTAYHRRASYWDELVADLQAQASERTGDRRERWVA